MIRTQIYITEKERGALGLLAHQTGKKQSELIRDAIDYFCENRLQKDRLAIMRSASGMWKERTDLPDFEALRKEMDRSSDK